MEYSHTLSPTSRHNRQHNSGINTSSPTVSRNNNLFQQYNNTINTRSLIQQHSNSQNGSSTFSNQFNFPLRSPRSPQKVNKRSHPINSQQQEGLDNNLTRQSRGDQNLLLRNINERQDDNDTDENNMSSTASPVYRIFKRGDNLPGINPLCLQTSLNVQNSGPNSSSSNISNSIQLDNGNESSSSSLLTLELINHHQQQQQQQEGGTSNTSLSNANVNTSLTTLDSSDSSACASTTGLNSSESNGQQSTTKSNRTPVSIIGDIARYHGLTAEYRLTNETGPPHAPTFTVVLVLGNEQYQAQGSSIKKAQLSAAAMAVEKNRSLIRPPSRAQPKKVYNQNGSHPKRTNWTIMQLNALAEELDEKLSFTSQPVFFEMNPFGKIDPPSLVAIHVGEKVFTGEGANFNAAKNQAAIGALKALLEMKRERELLKLAESGNLEVEDVDGKSPISVCHEMALKRGLPVSFEVKGEEGPPHLKVFTVQCIVGDSLTTDGTGPTKQQAKKSSCELMITKLKEIPLKLPKSTSISLKAMQKGLLKPKVARKKPSTPVVKEIDKQIVSPISRLLQIAHVRKYREPEFSIVLKPNEAAEQSIGGKSGHRNKKKKPIFTMEVKIGPHVCQGTGPNKKAAKKAAADAALVLLGYQASDSTLTSNRENGSANSDSDTINTTNDDATTKAALTKENESSYKMNSPLTAYRQIVPGLLVIKSSSGETNGQLNTSTTTPAHVAQEMIKVNSMPVSTTVTSSKSFDGIDKLSYLAELLGVSVSYSDFPKKSEFLSVVSIGMNPPHVGHGIGPTREEAQNSAALQILEELSTTGLDNV